MVPIAGLGLIEVFLPQLSLCSAPLMEKFVPRFLGFLTDSVLNLGA